MGNTTYKPEDNLNSKNQLPIDTFNKILADTELESLKKILKTMSQKYGVTPENITKIASETITLPLSIYSDINLSMLESTVKYLKEGLNLKYSKIGSLLNRDERTIWVTYHNSLKKSKKESKISEGLSIPIDILSDRKFGILELAVGFLKEEHCLRYSEIAKILKRDDRTIWTSYNRLKNKREIENEAA